MSRRTAYVDYQQRAKEFAVGDMVYPFSSGNQNLIGRVTAVFPGIGMVDVEWPHGSERKAVEELVRYEDKDFLPTETDSRPGGDLVPVSGGPAAEKAASSDPDRVRLIAEAFVKRALYWAAKDRKYKASTSELDTESFTCPKCKETPLKKAVYRRSEGASEHLLGCPECLFLINREDIIGCDEFAQAQARASDPLSKHRVASRRRAA